MEIVIGSDHSGYDMKEELKKYLQNEGYTVVDFGAYDTNSCDYPDYALLVAEAVSGGEYDRGLLIDGTGGGVCLVANKIKNIRAVTAYSSLTGAYASEHDNCNVLCLGAKMIGQLQAFEIVKQWINTPFAGGRHERRLEKIRDIEKRYFK